MQLLQILYCSHKNSWTMPLTRLLAGQGWIAPVPDNRWSTLAKIVPNLDDEDERDGTGAHVGHHKATLSLARDVRAIARSAARVSSRPATIDQPSMIP